MVNPFFQPRQHPAVSAELGWDCLEQVLRKGPASASGESVSDCASDLLFYSSCRFPRCLLVLFWAVSPSSSSHPFLIFLNRRDCRAPRVRNSACLCINVWPESTHNAGVWFFSLIFTLGQFFFFFSYLHPCEMEEPEMAPKSANGLPPWFFLLSCLLRIVW